MRTGTFSCIGDSAIVTNNNDNDVALHISLPTNLCLFVYQNAVSYFFGASIRLNKQKTRKKNNNNTHIEQRIECIVSEKGKKTIEKPFFFYIVKPQLRWRQC